MKNQMKNFLQYLRNPMLETNAIRGTGKMTRFDHLLKSGETAVRIVPGNNVKADDYIIIDWPRNCHPRLFQEPVRFKIDTVFSTGTIRVVWHDGIRGWVRHPFDLPFVNLPDSVWDFLYVVKTLPFPEEGSKC